MKTATSTPDNLDGAGLKIGILLSRFNDSIGNTLLENVVKTLTSRGVEESDVKTARVPGALELPLAAQELIAHHHLHAVIALGVIIKGKTYHFELVCQESHRGLMDVSLATKTPLVFGVITANNKEQAIARAEETQMNKGKEYAESAIEMALLMKQLRNK